MDHLFTRRALALLTVALRVLLVRASLAQEPFPKQIAGPALPVHTAQQQT